EEGFDRWMENVKALLKNHELNVCIHEEDRGTRSSSIIAIKASQPSDSTYLFADGHPCEVDYSLFSQKEP
ncbi:MAG: hypothetical protein SV377_03525, partial [Halobacteria archaeon]|nr:hypothetical protein [Halobacteria archaeon]